MTSSKIPPVYGLRIQRERRRKGLSVRELSESSGMATSTVQRAEQGQDALPVDVPGDRGGAGDPGVCPAR